MNIFQQFLYSLYSPKTIAKFRFQKIGKVILYVFFLMFIVSIPPTIILGTSISTFLEKTELHLQESIPDFEIVNGVLQSEQTDPIIIEEDNEYIIFDSTGELTVHDLDEYDTVLAILERETIFITEGVEYPLNYQQLNLNINKAELVDLISNVIGIMPLLIGLLALILYVYLAGSKFVGIFALSLLAMVMNSNRKTNLRYRQIWILSAYTVTLPTIIFALFDSLSIGIPYSFTIYWFIAFVMLLFVFKAIPVPKNHIDDSEEK
ncbi:DUF1189 domain-containing protein [Evansella sp. AB-P1]|uniref:DUF1189 domain-containing protein n=1 Tax=Evansella sp. AB-P1 TaxID=3037653 RepID=UPI00241DAFBD|nr:DUF1189 domain-containing protein [Evansella sp. AB-P1]MDG5788760.1 DUF1189 domain-containing protein [Evansella sp. AB-P1]